MLDTIKQGYVQELRSLEKVLLLGLVAKCSAHGAHRHWRSRARRNGRFRRPTRRVGCHRLTHYKARVIGSQYCRQRCVQVPPQCTW